MTVLPNRGEEKEDEGCFVYKALRDVIVLCAPSIHPEYRSTRWFRQGDLASVDQILHVSLADGVGPYLRLSDGSGWLCEGLRDLGQLMERVEVETGLWGFYVQNDPIGVVVRNHPMDQLQEGQNNYLYRVPEIKLKPLRKVFCDRRVVGKNGIKFYRVQGIKHYAWIFDIRISGDIEKIDSNQEEIEKHLDIMLLPESKVQTGLFAFQALHEIDIRSMARVGDDLRTGWSIKKNHIVTVNLIVEPPFPNSGNGPYLRLTDGTGWLFVSKDNQKVMRQLPIEEGLWKLRVCKNVGIQPRIQPIDDTPNRYSKVYTHTECVVSDRRIPAPPTSKSDPGTFFYRIEGNLGWLFDRRGSQNIMELIESSPTNDNPGAGVTRDAWTSEFVRGIVTALEGLEEMAYDASNHVISFRHRQEGALINVFHLTRVVCTTLDPPSHGRTQLTHRDCTVAELVEILKNPRVHTVGDSKAQPASQEQTSTAAEDLNIEDEFRNRILDLDDEMDALRGKRRALLKALTVHEARREKNEEKMEKLRRQHFQVLKRQAIEKEREERTCQHCGLELESKAGLEQHFDDQHRENTCRVCGKVCRTQHLLGQHMQAVGHFSPPPMMTQRKPKATKSTIHQPKASKTAIRVNLLQ